ncbi:class D sortase [Anaerolineales bacterium HSG6]|nr:class D sortase [Anaerolineales bacterium HSG6]
MFGKRKVDDLSVEELEQMLRIKRRETRIDRFQQLTGAGHSVSGALMAPHNRPPASSSVHPVLAASGGSSTVGLSAVVMEPLPTFKQRLFSRWRRKPKPSQPKKRATFTDRILLVVELAALLTLFGVIGSAYFSLQELNTEAALAQQSVVTQQQIAVEPTSAPPIALAQLPGGHSPPSAGQAAMPDVPLHLQQWVQPRQTNSPAPVSIVTSSQAPTRLVIPKINVDAPIVGGVGWDDLKKGVGHLPGSANPGERGNLYLAAHNDIYGEIFRYLEKLEVGDTYIIYAGEQKFEYIVTERRIIEPIEVEVMLPTTEPVATLQTCYPYLIDTHRLVVIGELVE